jgi:hypothetical protein
MPRKQEFRRGTASYRLAKAQGRLPEKKGKPIKKVISDIGKALGSLTGRKDLSATRTNVGEGTVLKRPDITGEQAIAKFQELKSGKPSTTKKNAGTKTFKKAHGNTSKRVENVAASKVIILGEPEKPKSKFRRGKRK